MRSSANKAVEVLLMRSVIKFMAECPCNNCPCKCKDDEFLECIDFQEYVDYVYCEIVYGGEE